MTDRADRAAGPHKRPASEPATTILAADELSSAPTGRPGAIIGGTVLVLLRAAGGALWAAGLVVTWPTVRAEVGLQPGVESRLLLAILLGLVAAWIVVLLLFAWLVWRGSNGARILVMFWVATSITASAVSYFASGAEITIRTTLLTLSLDILVLLALSSRTARAWTRDRSVSRRQSRSRRGARRR